MLLKPAFDVLFQASRYGDIVDVNFEDGEFVILALTAAALLAFT